MLQQNSQFFYSESWNQFNDWYKNYLTYITLNKIVEKVHEIEINQYSNEQLNKLFLEVLNENFREDSKFIYDFTKEINFYFSKWSNEFLNPETLGHLSFKTILNSISMNDHWQSSNMNLIYEDYYVVMSNLPYYLITKTIGNYHVDFNDINQCTKLLIPINRIGKVTGEIEIELNEYHQKLFKKTHKGKYRLTEVVIDVLDIINSYLLEQESNPLISINLTINELLEARGLKEKLAGNGQRGGYDQTQKQQMIAIFDFIQNISLNLNIERRSNLKKSITGQIYDIRKNKNDVFSFDFGPALKALYELYKNQMKMMHKKIVYYDSYQCKWEKRIGRYLSWRWRTQARKQEYMQPYKIGHLLEVTGLSHLESSPPSVIRERFEKALDRLATDQIISSWQYFRWDEDVVGKKGWLKSWKQATIVIIPPEIIIKHYRSIGGHTKSLNVSNKLSELDYMEKPSIQIISRIQTIRKENQITLEVASKQIGISLSYLNHIEKGRKLPSSKIYRRIKRWIESF